ncbi:MAG: PolC-type DNA polymerase III [Clostridiales bacterium]|nr:PolC-type DNA polymerase III [Eubacteriales bacterium]MDH7564902.1 PolC-type DNA polymerase III [Clostridiales bacterium]
MQNVTYHEQKFMNLFPETNVGGEISGLMQNATIQKINVYKKSRRLEIFILSKKLIPSISLFNIEEKLAALFKLKSVDIRAKFDLSMPLEKILEEYWDSLVYRVNRRVALSRGILSGCTWDLCEKKLMVNLKTKGKSILRSQECHRLLENMIEEFFSCRVKVEFVDPVMDDAAIDSYLELKEHEEAGILSMVEASAPRGGSGTKERKGEDRDCEKKWSLSPVIVGREFSDDIMKMCDVTQDSGRVAVCGDIFSVDFKEIRGGKYICIFDVTDTTSSLTVKYFANKEITGNLKERIKEGVCVKLRGEAQYDKFSKELAIMASDIIEVEKAVRTDEAEVKRVELHLHTQMSSMDGVTPVGELIKRAAQWGHRAVAITDHGVVQAFPDAAQAAAKHKIKVIYGVECYLLDDRIPVVYNPNGQPLDEEFVVLDIETTGLNYDRDRITEIGAVKVKGGKITGEFSSLVNPQIPIPSFIVKLTGITDDMVREAPTIEEVLPGFIEFLGNSAVVAHNAPFDMGFIKYNARTMGINVDNPIVDTLQLCRNLFPNLKKHKLNIVAHHLGIKMDNHHRAVDDSKTTAEIFVKCLEMLEPKSIKTIDDIEGCFEENEDFKKAASYHAIILAANYTGLRNLYRIISYSHLKYYYKKPRVPKNLLMQYRDGLILGSACESGELYRAILDGKKDDEIIKIARFYDYLEIQPLGNNQFLINSGRVKSQEELKNINRKIVELGEKLKKPVVATCDVHFMDPWDEVFRRILMAGQGFEDADNQAPLFLRTTDEMLQEFDYLGSEKAYEVVVENTNRIADRIEEIIPIPEGTFPPKIEGAEEEVEGLAKTRAKEIYGDPLPEIVGNRLEKELNSIIKNGFSVMYIIAQKLVAKSLSDGYLVGSRGSVGSSFVANMIGITEVNSLPPHYVCDRCKYSEFITDGSVGCGFDLPDKECPKCGNPLKKDGYDIPFETFLGFDGDKEPDIDLNFSGEYQSRAHKYTEELFGEGKVFRAGTIGTIADKTAYGFIKNYLDERGIVVPNAEINRLVKGCTGVKRTTGQHPGGVMIVPRDRDIFEFCPIQHPADDMDSGIITTHFDYHSISGRLLKLDILGHDDPTVIKMLEDLTGVKATTIPIGEKNTMGIFSGTEPLGIKPEDINSEVGTLAVPEFGTKFVRQMLVETKPTTFYELIRIAGLAHGTDVWINNAQELIKSETCTLSEAICCRDDIMLYLIRAGLPSKTAFKIMEDVRKGKGLKEEYEQVMKENKVPGWYIESCKKIKYMFPKAHAAAYVMMSYRVAWYKVYYPEAFYVAYFTVRADEFDAELMTHGPDKIKNKINELEKKGNSMTQKEKNVLTILEVANEMYARGIRFLPVDLYESDALKFQITPKGIRPPLNALQGLGTAAAQNIVEARENGEFMSVDDLRIRAKISKAVIEILQQHGCLDGLPQSNQLSLF